MAVPWEGAVRRIETIDDVLAVLASTQASFIELLDCVDVAAKEDRWDLRKAAAERAFQSAVDVRDPRPEKVSEALELLVEVKLHDPGSLTELAAAVRELRTSLESSHPRFKAHPVLERFIVTDQFLSELLVLLTATEPGSGVKLCSKLRRIKRSDLAIEAATKALEAGADRNQALTTRGAAYGDCRQFEQAFEDLGEVLASSKDNHFAVTALSRVLQTAGRTKEACDLARRALEICSVEPVDDDALRAGALRLITIAVVVEDARSIAEAREILARIGPVSVGLGGEGWIDCYVAEALLNEGRLDDAAGMISRAKPGATGDLALKLSRLGRRLRSAQIAAQPKLDLDGDHGNDSLD